MGKQLMITKEDSDRFMSKVTILANGCWQWKAKIGTNGYGHFWASGKDHLAHRVSLVIAGEVLIPGMQIDHLCRIRACVNPKHLQQVTAKENTLRSPMCPSAMNAKKTHCKRGHELSGLNLHINSFGARVCRKCASAQSTQWAKNNREKVNAMQRRRIARRNSL